MAEFACHDIGLTSNRKVQLIGDAVVANGRATEVFYQLFDLSGYRHSAGHGSVIVAETARRKWQAMDGGSRCVGPQKLVSFSSRVAENP